MMTINTDHIVSTLEHLLTVPSPVGYYAEMKPVLEQYALAEFISSGNFERHLNRKRRKLSKTNREETLPL